MIFIWVAYAVLFAIWALAESNNKRGVGYPRWLFFAEATSKAILFVGICLYLTGINGTIVVGPWRTILVVGVALEMFVRAFAMRFAEEDGDSHAVNVLVNLITMPFFLGIFVAPAVYLGWRVSGLSVVTALLILCPTAAAAFLAGLFWPKHVPAFHDEEERRMVKWLEESFEYRRAPDEIIAIDEREQTWPGFDQQVRCSLFRIRYGTQWYVALAAPVCYCLSEPLGKDYAVAEAYEKYRDWFANKIAGEMILVAAKDLPSDFQRLVRKAVSEQSNDK